MKWPQSQPSGLGIDVFVLRFFEIEVTKMTAADPVKQMKMAVAQAAAARVQSNTIVGLGTGSTTALLIQCLGERLKSGDLTNIQGVPTSFQASVLAKQNGIPLVTLDDVDQIDVAIDGADEVDPQKNLIKGGGAAHTREKVVDALAKQFIVVVDGSKLVDKLGSTFPVPLEVLPMAIAPVSRAVIQLGGKPELRMGVKKDGPVITDQGNMVLDVKFDSIPNPAELEKTLNNIPGVVENGIFVGVTDLVLIGEIKDGQPIVREM
jgi:ribose 5-phosphate isomerase A